MTTHNDQTAEALIDAIASDNEWRREHKAPAHPVEQPFTAWIRSVEERLKKLTAAGSGDSTGTEAGTATGPRAGTALPRDATTAALVRAGEALAAKQAESVLPAAEHSEPETCFRCGKPLKVNGRLRSCAHCSASWMASEKRPSLAQSAWAVDEGPIETGGTPGEFADAMSGAQDAALKVALVTVEARDAVIQRQAERIREIQAALDVANDALSAARVMIETRDRNIAILAAANDARVLAARDARVRELEAEVEHLKAANATRTPDDPVAMAEQATVVDALQDMLVSAAVEWSEAGVVRKACWLLKRLRECSLERIEFSVKEVLP